MLPNRLGTRLPPFFGALLVIEQLDLDLLLSHGPPLEPKETKPGSRTALQRAMATQVGPEAARTMMGPLAGLYDLRLNDAHAAAEKVTTGIRLLGIDQSQPLVHQGARLLSSTAQALEQAAQVVEKWNR